MIEQRLRCGGKIHKIVLTEKGRLCLLNHTKEELRAEEVVHKLGGAVCPCAAILFAWREGDRRSVMYPSFRRAVCRHVDMRGYRTLEKVMPDLRSQIREWGKERVEEIFGKAYDMCHFRRPWNHKWYASLSEAPTWKAATWKVAIYYPVNPKASPSVSCYSTGSSFQSGVYYHGFVISWKWPLTCGCIGDGGVIYRRKRPRLVIDVQGSRLLTVKQGKKYKIETEWVEAKEGECPPSNK